MSKTIESKYREMLDAAKKQHDESVKDINDWYKEQVAVCPHTSKVRKENVFFCYGEGWPGEVCLECGGKFHV